MNVLGKEKAKFKKIVKNYYRVHGRHGLPWRKTTDPYRITVSELMLQQTQVPRVIEKYKEFLKMFPTIHVLAKAPLADVLRVWSGLGYNRRAKFLHMLAREIVATRKGKFPSTVSELESLPGIGPYTARAVVAFAYNQPVVFIETNIRTVFIHHFFPGKKNISDKELMPLIEMTLDRANPRVWYAALMDYGSYLKQTGNKVHRNSTHYKKQSPFIGSRRALRGAILRVLLDAPKTSHRISLTLNKKKELVISVLDDLEKEKIIEKQGQKYHLASD